MAIESLQALVTASENRDICDVIIESDCVDRGVTQAEFEAGAADAAERCFRSVYPDTMGDDALWQEQLEWTRSAENVNADMMMYPDENGKLMLLSPIGSLAGASYYEHSYPFAE